MSLYCVNSTWPDHYWSSAFLWNLQKCFFSSQATDNFNTRDTCRCELQLNTKLGIMSNINLLKECLPLLEVIKAAFLVFAVYWGSVIELTDDDYLTRSGNRTLVTFRHEWDFHPLLLWNGRILLKRAHFLFFSGLLTTIFYFSNFESSCVFCLFPLGENHVAGIVLAWGKCPQWFL